MATFASLLAIVSACTTSDSSADPTPPPPPNEAPVPAPVPVDPQRALADARAATATIREQGNHLVGQPSPYLEQHSHNPVDWHPWGEEALDKAKAQGKPIFLSIGYSTCHWCHVMEHESFEDDEVAAYLNAFFISIKVDREQRPDIDALYIDAVSAMGGSTGWPLTVFLTPNLEPYFGGTYFPRNPGRGRPGFLEVLAQVRQEWNEQGPAAAAKGRDVFARVQRQALAASPDRGLDATVLPTAMRSLSRARDLTEGGFGRRQKFPNPPLLGAQLQAAIAGDDAARAHLTLSLDKMRAGGVRDHVSGSFHRYAVDVHWHVPHFERMLYDNAQLAALYIDAGLALERDDWVQTGREVLDELLENWRGAGNAFVVGFDADDPGGEGAFYSWTPAELTTLLGSDDAKLVIPAFDVTAKGERELGGRSVLHRQDDEEVAKATGSTTQAVREAVARALPKMAEARTKRPPPARDDKVLVAWNALAIIALADAGRKLDEPRYVAAALEAASFVRDQCWQGGAMLRGYRDETSLGPGVLDDHALAGLAFVRLHAATGDLQWLELAESMMRAVEANFFDQEAMTFMGTSADGELPVRLADMNDGVLPSGGSAAVRLALELGAIAGDLDRIERAEGVLGRVRTRAQTRPFGSGYLLQAFDFATAKVREVVIAGGPEDPMATALWNETRALDHNRFLPVRVPAQGVSATRASTFAALAGKKALSKGATAYVCERGSCQSPTSDPAQLRKLLALEDD